MNKRRLLLSKFEEFPEPLIEKIWRFIQNEPEGEKILREFSEEITVDELTLANEEALSEDWFYEGDAVSWEDMKEEI